MKPVLFTFYLTFASLLAFSADPGVLEIVSFSALGLSDEIPAGLPSLHKPPQLTGLLELEALTGSGAEPVDCVFAAGRLYIAFSDRFLALGPHLQVVPRTNRDLYARARLPAGFIITNIALSPLNEPVLFNAGSGEAVYHNFYAGNSELFNTGIVNPLDFTGLPRGGFALLTERQIRLFFRKERGLRGPELQSREIPLPPGLFSALAADQEGNLWIFDLTERRILAFSREGKELFSIKPVIKPGFLPFPQVLAALPGGGFLLGGAGELWRFTQDGLPVWRLTSAKPLFRETLPAFFKLAVSGNGSCFFLLDPAAGRVLKFNDFSSLPENEDELDRKLAALFSEAGIADSGRLGKLIDLYLENELYLPAGQILAALEEPGSAGRAKTRLKTQIERLGEEKKALNLAVLAQNLKKELLLPEADEFYGQSQSAYRELRSQDPVNPFYPAVLRGLTRTRLELREILFAEPIIDAAVRPPEIVPTPEGQAPAAEDAPIEVQIELLNVSGTALEDLSLELCLAGISSGMRLSRPGRIEPGGVLAVDFTIRPDRLTGETDEDLLSRLSLLISFTREEKKMSLYYKFPFIIRMESEVRGRIDRN